MNSQSYRVVEPDAPDVPPGHGDASILGVDEEKALREEDYFACGI